MQKPARPQYYITIVKLFTILSSLVLFGCTSVKFVSDYDETIDKGVTEIQKAVEAQLVKIEKAGRAAFPLSAEETAFFDKIVVDLSALQIRAQATPKNEITVKMLALLRKSMDDLQELMISGISKEHVAPIRSAVNISTGAILKFEIAKKRGEPAAK